MLKFNNIFYLVAYFDLLVIDFINVGNFKKVRISQLSLLLSDNCSHFVFNAKIIAIVVIPNCYHWHIIYV